ncbi:hypothetical protein BXZ70DRAFT_421810 [Cristinia sonorae]|uniref:DUF7719 domain-containing protein n=1 Tax=Cristinia sonorae TaxID=1940300 RepID=A0A8K0UXC6_9AGAR|nr:hypothetical protein BXZ70DRAFT_421810 [Cristinia sonorae]
MAKLKKRKPTQVPPSEEKPLVDISEADQWRIIKDSGVLEQVPGGGTTTPATTQPADPDELLSPFTLELFAALALTIPHCFLLLMMEFLIHYQYGRKPTMDVLIDRMVPGVPIIALFVFYTNRYKHTRSMQLGFFLMSILSSTRLVWIINRASWITNMKQAPPLATIAVYAVVQSDLLPAFVSLLVIGVWIWYKSMKLFP